MKTTYNRNCPICNELIKHLNKSSRNQSVKNNRPCRKCSVKASSSNPSVIKNRQKFVERYCGIANSGEANAFYGKKHTESVKNKLKFIDKTYAKTNKFKNKISIMKSGKNNPMYGKTYYDVWVKKYGKEEADKKQELKRKKQSILSKGENNHMYGKPSPQGSGNGWSGWYKGWFFRSLKELSYVVKTLEAENKDWKDANKIRIKYIFNGSEKTYTPDFIVDNIFLIEIKPLKLHSSSMVIAKSNAANEYCQKNNLQFLLIDPPMLTQKEIHQLYVDNKIKFIERYEIKYQKLIESH